MSVSIYRCLMYRLNSFLCYPNSAFFRPPQLANLGFYSSGRGEEVTCCGCEVSHANFQPGQNIRRAHIQRSPNCPLNIGGEVLQADDANAADNVVPQDLPNPLPIVNRPLDNQTIGYFSRDLQAEIEFTRSKPDFKLLRIEGIPLRRLTFFDWPGDYDDRAQLSLRGFFYTGRLDKIQCCSCGVMYKNEDLQTVPDLRQTQCRESCRRYF